MRWFHQGIGKFTLILFSFVGAFVIDAILPNHIIVTSLYAVSILLTAYWFSPHVVEIVSIFSVSVFIWESWVERVIMINLAFGIFGLVLIAILAMQMSMQRAALQQFTQELNRTHTRLQSFMQMVSHDLLQPVTTLKLFVQLTQRKKNIDMSTLIFHIENVAHQMERLAIDLKDTAAMESGQFSISPVSMDLVKLLKRIVKQQQLGLKNHTISLETPKTLKGRWDEDRLSQVFTNLISNAIKYSPKGGKVFITCEHINDNAHISIRDQGLGMNATQIQQLFQPFSRQHKNHKIAGTGLGLFITKAVIEMHKGHISVNSRSGKGSTFQVSLPLNTT